MSFSEFISLDGCRHPDSSPDAWGSGERPTSREKGKRATKRSENKLQDSTGMISIGLKKRDPCRVEGTAWGVRASGPSVNLRLRPVVHVWHEGFVFVGPDFGSNVPVLVRRLGVMESHVVGVQKLHHLWRQKKTSGTLCLFLQPRDVHASVIFRT